MLSSYSSGLGSVGIVAVLCDAVRAGPVNRTRMMARTAPKKVSPKRTATKTKTRSAKSDENTVNALKSASREVAGADTFKPNVPETLAERYPLATAILSVRWPSVEQLREIIRACRSMADTLRVNVLTTAEDCPLRLPTVRSNPRAIDAAVADVEVAYAIRRLCPTQSGKASKVPVFLGPNVVTGWGHNVEHLAPNLAAVISGLLLYLKRQPLMSRQSFRWGEKVKADGKWDGWTCQLKTPPKQTWDADGNRTDGGLPIDWLNAIDHLTSRLEAEVNKVASSTPKSGSRAGENAGGERSIEIAAADLNRGRKKSAENAKVKREAVLDTVKEEWGLRTNQAEVYGKILNDFDGWLRGWFNTWKAKTFTRKSNGAAVAVPKDKRTFMSAINGWHPNAENGAARNANQHCAPF